MSDKFKKSRRELKDLMGFDPVPNTLSNLVNSLIVNQQIGSLDLMPWDSVARTEYMIRLWQDGPRSKTFHGEKGNLLPLSLKENGKYVTVDSGFGFKPSLALEIGVARPGKIANPHMIGKIPPNPIFPQSDGLKKHAALTLWVDYADKDNMTLQLSLDNFGKGLNLTSPQNDFEMDTALKLIGQTINDIIDGEDVDFAELREALIQHAGLAETGDLPAQLREDFTGEDRPAPANPATTGVTDPTQASAPTPGGAG